MADSERRVFPIETVLALAAGKKDCDLREIAGYILGDNPEELTVFAIMSNNHIGESKDMQDIIEDMLGELL